MTKILIFIRLQNLLHLYRSRPTRLSCYIVNITCQQIYITLFTNRYITTTYFLMCYSISFFLIANIIFRLFGGVLPIISATVSTCVKLFFFTPHLSAFLYYNHKKFKCQVPCKKIFYQILCFLTRPHITAKSNDINTEGCNI